MQLSCIMQDNASPMRISPNKNQHICFTNIYAGNFHLLLCAILIDFSGTSEPTLFLGCCSHAQEDNLEISSHIDFSLLLERKKKVCVSSPWGHFYLEDFFF